MASTSNCADCGHEISSARNNPDTRSSHEGRGLCTPCYSRANYQGRLADYDRRTRTRDEVLSEWDHLRRSGVEFEFAHERLGMTKEAFRVAYQRARAAGDPRTLEGPGQRGINPQVARAREAARSVDWSSAPSMQRALTETFGDDHALAQ